MKPAFPSTPRWAGAAILLGLITTPVTAWLLWHRPPPAGQATMVLSIPPASGAGAPVACVAIAYPGIGGGDLIGFELINQSAATLHARDIQQGLNEYTLSAGNVTVRPKLPAWMGSREFALTDERTMFITQGVPFRCLRGTSRGKPTANPPHRLGVVQTIQSNPWPRGVLALSPIWPGFLANTAIYASAWFILFAVVRHPAHRRQSRIRQGLCLRCGYDVKAQPACPECGLGMPAR